MIQDQHTRLQARHSANYDIPLSRIELLISHEFKVSLAQLQSASRGLARVAKARHVAVYLAHVVLGISLTALARHFKRDRTTIAYACKTIEDARDDINFDTQLNRLEAQLTTLLPASFKAAH